MDEGFELNFKDKVCIVKNPSSAELFTVKMKNKCFPLNWMDIKHTTYNCILNDTEMWHKRVAYVNYDSLKLMAADNLVEGLPLMANVKKIYDVCMYGKQKNVPFLKTSTWRATQRLQLIHTDLGGPMKIPSLNGSKYYILFIDDYLRFC